MQKKIQIRIYVGGDSRKFVISPVVVSDVSRILTHGGTRTSLVFCQASGHLLVVYVEFELNLKVFIQPNETDSQNS